MAGARPHARTAPSKSLSSSRCARACRSTLTAPAVIPPSRRSWSIRGTGEPRQSARMSSPATTPTPAAEERRERLTTASRGTKGHVSDDRFFIFGSSELTTRRGNRNSCCSPVSGRTCVPRWGLLCGEDSSFRVHPKPGWRLPSPLSEDLRKGADVARPKKTLVEIASG